MTSDVVVVLLLTVVFTVARPLILPGTPLSLGAFTELAHEAVGSVAVGVTLGLLFAAYLRFVGRDLVLLFVALGLVMTPPAPQVPGRDAPRPLAGPAKAPAVQGASRQRAPFPCRD